MSTEDRRQEACCGIQKLNSSATWVLVPWLTDAFVCIVSSTCCRAFSAYSTGSTGNAAFAAAANLAMVGMVCWNHAILMPGTSPATRWLARQTCLAMWAACLAPVLAVAAFLMSTLAMALCGTLPLIALSATQGTGKLMDSVQDFAMPLALFATAGTALCTLWLLSCLRCWLLPEWRLRWRSGTDILGAASFGLLLLPFEQLDGWLGGSFGLLTAMSAIPWVACLAMAARREGT